MYYSSIGLLAALILMIENHDIIFRRPKQDNPTFKIYRSFLFGVLAYYVTDILWGVLDGFHLMTLLFLDTQVYYLAMALGVFFWSQYVIAYLNGKTGYGRALSLSGYIFAGAVALVVVVNFFVPVLFWFDEAGVYHACMLRHIFLIIQVLLFLLTSLYTFSVIARKKNEAIKRYRAISLFGLAMAVMLSVQLLYPLLPLYSAGYMLGTSLLHIFVFGDEKETYQKELEQSLLREKRQRAELMSAQRLALTDGLTSVRNKLAYSQFEVRKDLEIAEGTAKDFAIAVFDLNWLKETNDRKGHEAGDHLLRSACELICKHFAHSPVFRIGGDEFTAFLEGEDYRNRAELMKAFDALVEENVKTGGVVVAGGISDFRRGEDRTCMQVFGRADKEMYRRKREMKSL